jgi:two-component sensor histidine kinase
MGKDGEGNPNWLEVIATPVKDEDGNISGAMELVIPITERKKAEEDLRKREEEARKLANENAIVAKIGRIISSTLSIEEVYKLFAGEVKNLLSFDRIVINMTDAEKKFLVNPFVEGNHVVGRGQGEIFPLRGTLMETVIRAEKGFITDFQDEDELTAEFPGLLPEFRAGFRSFLSVPLISQQQVVGGLHLRSKKYKAFAEEDLRLAECVANQIAGAIANTEVFLERKRAEEQLRASLKEKEVLLREIHHRVKNNLQVISSLLRLQSRYIKDEEVQKVFKESQDRVRTMAIIHEKLYQSTDLTRVDFAEYIKDLTANLYRSYGVSQETIGLSIHGNNLFMGVDMANPCGLIINELVSNSLKYAFPGGKRGEIFIDLRSDHDQIILTVGDNGRAFPKGLDFRKTQSLGLQLVISLVEQLEGTIELHSDGQTEFRIAFPAKQPM